MLIKKNWSSIIFILTMGLLAIKTLPLIASENTKNLKTSYLAQNEQSRLPWSDGIYFYGQSEKLDQIGQEYLVFKVNQKNIIGVFYMPSSEYNCFQGRVEEQRINLSIRDTYNNSTYAHSIAIQERSLIAAEGSKIKRFGGLQGYKPIGKIRKVEQEMLDICEKSF